MLLHGGFFFFYCSNQLRERTRIHKCASLHCRGRAHCSHVQGLRTGPGRGGSWSLESSSGPSGLGSKDIFFLFKWVLRFHETSRYPAGHGPTSQSDDRSIYHGINLLPLRLVTTGLLSESGEKVFIKVNTHTLIFKAFSSAYIYYEPEI